MRTRYNDHTYRKRTASLKRRTTQEQLPCWLCGRPIDTTLDWKHPMAFTADHVEAIANGGKLLGELRPAHRKCNSSRGKGNRRTPKIITQPKTTREW